MSVQSFDLFRRSQDMYHPRTARAALLAAKANLVPLAACVYLGTSVKPIDEEPIDLDDLEHLLSRKNLDLETNLLLMRVLTKMLRDPDAEVALFAAESINTIENRYTKRIEELKGKLKQGEDAALMRQLASLYYELAQMHPTSIRNFYLREAYGYFKRLNSLKQMKKTDVALLVRLLLLLKLTDQAKRIIDQLADRDDPFYLILEAELEFQRGNILRVHELCEQIKSGSQRLDQATRLFVNYWLEEQDG
jgi:hypothetical protein